MPSHLSPLRKEEGIVSDGLEMTFPPRDIAGRHYRHAARGALHASPGRPRLQVRSDNLRERFSATEDTYVEALALGDTDYLELLREQVQVPAGV
jgi:hypothetical protein